MKILITGGSGFIGSHVVENLLSKGHQVTVFDHQVRPHENTETFLGDIRDTTSVNEAVSHHDAVMHLAGILGTAETVSNPLPSIETNIVGSLNVLQACRQFGKKAVDITVGNHWMLNSYAITKSTVEKLTLMFNKEYNTKVALVRGFNVYGPRQKVKPVRKIAPSFIMSALRDEELLINGDGEQIADMIYVKDMAEILVRALLMDHGIYDRIFEAGTGRRTSVKTIAEEIIRLVGKGKIKYIPMRQGEELQAVVLGNPKTLKPLDFYIFTPLEDGLGPTIEWYRKNEL